MGIVTPSDSWRAALARCLVVCIPASLSAAAAPAVAGDLTTGSTYSIQEVLTADGRESPSACGHVDYGDVLVSGRPPSLSPNPNGPTHVDVTLFVLAVSDIDPSTNSFGLEAYAGLTWCDPRQAFDDDEYGVDRKIIVGQLVDAALETMWWPGVFLPSRLGGQERSSEQLIVYSDGTLRFRLVAHARMIARYDFSQFPLDEQELRILVQNSLWRSNEVELHEAPGQVGFNEGFEIPEWKVLGSSSTTGRIPVPGKDEGFSGMLMQIRIGRRVGFYFWKILLPLLVIFGTAWSTFWMTREALAQRQRMSATSVLTVVAYQFVAMGDLPRVSYLTTMDVVMLWTFLVVGASLITNTLNKRKHRIDPDSGLAADRAGRWWYPTLYFGGMFLILGVRGLF